MTESRTTRPVPIEDIDTRGYWEATRQHRFELPRCDGCGKFCFPPRPRCPACLSTNLSWTELSGRGTVYSFTVVCVPIVRGFEPPYAVAQVELAEQPGLRIITNIVDCDPNDVHIGMPVELTFEELDAGGAVPQFRPASADRE